MIYLIKSITFSGLLYLLYKVILEKEKMFHFNRFYLLFSVIFSLTIPFVEVSVVSPTIPVMTNFDSFVVLSQSPNAVYIPLRSSEGISFYNIMLILYIAITLVFFIRFCRNLLSIRKSIRRSEKILHNGIVVILTKTAIEPYSFLNYIFVSKVDYMNGAIDKHILSHEFAHIKQRHSFDIVILELIRVFAWFNPVFIFLIKSIRLNHEFLADEYVINDIDEPKTYQYLLLESAQCYRNTIFSSSFNYLVTKKRLTMMKKQTAFSVALIKQIATVFIVAGVVLAFATKVSAQENEKKKTGDNFVPFKTIIVYDGLDIEYKSIVNKYFSGDKTKNGFPVVSEADKKRLKEIYFQMSEEQRSQQKIVFMKFPPLERKTPTQKQLDAWKDAKEYGVWIDGVRIENSKLNNYRNVDFHNFFESKVLENAVNYGKHKYQVNLMTKEYFKKMQEELSEDDGYAMTFKMD
ncbi:MAG: M56 family metallopeptidase [Bacteroidales bacterium]